MTAEQFKVTMFLAVLLVLLVAALVLLLLSFRAQREYDSEALPSLEAVEGGGSSLPVPVRPEEVSAFHLEEDEEDALPLPGGDREAEELLAATRAAAEGKKKERFGGLFKKP